MTNEKSGCHNVEEEASLTSRWNKTVCKQPETVPKVIWKLNFGPHSIGSVAALGLMLLSVDIPSAYSYFKAGSYRQQIHLNNAKKMIVTSNT